MRAEGRNGTVDLVGDVASVRSTLPRVTYRLGGRRRALAPTRLAGPPEGPWTATDEHLRLGLAVLETVVEAFTVATLPVRGGRVDLGRLDPHDVRILRLPRRGPTAGG